MNTDTSDYEPFKTFINVLYLPVSVWTLVTFSTCSLLVCSFRFYSFSGSIFLPVLFFFRLYFSSGSILFPVIFFFRFYSYSGFPSLEYRRVGGGLLAAV